MSETGLDYILKTVHCRPIIALAPLAGLTDHPFRKICTRFGADFAVTEMISSEALIRRVPKTLHMLKYVDEEPRTLVQIMGSSPKVMAEAAKIAEDLGAMAIDINMGCPEKRIVSQGAGSALLKDPERAVQIVKEVVKAVDLPVTVKIRLGWGHGEFQAKELVKVFENLGIKMVVIHARTRNQMFRGTPNWLALSSISQDLKIPLIANGDVVNSATFKSCLSQAKAQGVMIGRGALGRPWIFSQLNATSNEAPKEEMLHMHKDLILEHLHSIISFYGSHRAITPLRLHLSWYSKGLKGSAKFRETLTRTQSPSSMINEFEKFIV
ncbi:tRNA dihydrouridine synthase B [Dissulfuribacter thermophilus]|uniref:tRNA-dihydrouridine synthase n=1 Tax=Dissulfuribacter thermophilus TaxID=1156395 RepID=A0A1B9F6X7_9BACT|nr:tRNA dihydrouridine synthase DusB [Dissulfuribacter thermophilus]OCC15699.1 tRNA dihydrouridine synthase B [Dissulfuribacter thermophilus]